MLLDLGVDIRALHINNESSKFLEDDAVIKIMKTFYKHNFWPN